MPRPTIIALSTLWLLSLGTAYFIGTRSQSEATDAAEHTESKAASEAAHNPDRLIPAALTPSDSLVGVNLSALLDGERIAIEDALAEIPLLDSTSTRELLASAFMLPSSQPDRGRIIRALLENLAKTDPEGALELASSVESMREKERARIAVLQEWGQSDPSAALAWANQNLRDEPPRTRRAQISSIYRGYAVNNPQAAFNQALAIENDSRMRDQALNAIISTQVNSGNLQSAKQAIDAVDDDGLKTQLRAELVEEWASFDPEAAGRYVEALGDQASTRVKTELLGEWAESDPAAAAAWLGQLADDDPAIARASSAIIREWTRYDLNSSAEWLNSLPASPELDRAIISYTFRAAEEDPAAAMTWAESIENDRRRTWMMERVAATWKTKDAGAFTQYLDNSELTEAQRKKLEEAQNRGGRRW